MNDIPKHLQNLNQVQREAVTHKDGPLLIVAGAGTGKTKVITSRIVYLIRDAGVKTSEILALTFTEKATEEMIERVDLMMPLSYEEIWIKTFHGFCDRILRERGSEIGIDPGYRILSSTDQWLLLKKNLFRLELDYYRPLGNPSRFLVSLISFFGRLKDEYISPENFLSYTATLPEEDDLQKEEKKRLRELSNAYKTYQELLLEQNALDFGDLVFYTMKLMETRPSVLDFFQEKFRFILVDEFQDTNFIQTKLVLLLASKYKNIAVVGDDDQSIYRWRGASLSNIFEFQKQFPNARHIVLTENYRSMQPILDAAHAFIQKNNPERLEFREQLSKKLRSARSNVEKDAAKKNEPAQSSKNFHSVKIHHFGNYLDEVSHVADQIASLVQNGISYRDIAILGRSNQHLKAFIEELKVRKIPYQVRTAEGMFSLEEIKDLLAVARLVNDPADDIAMYRFLQLDVFDIPMESILHVFREAKKGNFSVYEFISQSKSPQQTLFETDSQLQHAFKILKDLIVFSKQQTPLKIFLEFLHTSKYLQRLIEDERSETVEKVQNLHRFGRFVDHFEKSEVSHSLYDFLEYIELLEEARGEHFEEVVAADYDAVQLLTVHSAKGLEFSRVFVVSVVQSRFPSTDRKEVLDIPEALMKEAAAPHEYHLHEERRLMYVACTRARDELILTYSDTYEGKKKWKPSVFLEELKEINAKNEAKNPDDVIVHEQHFPSSTHRLDELFKTSTSPLLRGARLHKSLKRFSYSQFDTFKTCPLKYRYRYLFPIPTPPSHAANFGSSIHNTLNHFYRALKRGEPVSLELLNGLFEQEWIPYGYESKAHENAQKKKGFEMLRHFYEKNSVPEFVTPFALEKAFSMKIGDLSVSGRIDRIDRLEDGTYEVIDYKTGTSKRDSNLAKDLQLSLYAWACRDVFKIPVSKLSLYFLEDQGRKSTTRNGEEIDATKEEIVKLASELRESEYQPTPGFHCQFCEYRLVCPAV